MDKILFYPTQIDRKQLSEIAKKVQFRRCERSEAISILLLGINSTTPGLPRSFGARNDVFH